MNRANEETRLHFKLTYLHDRLLAGFKNICSNPLALAATVIYWCLALALVGSLPSDNILDALLYPVLCICVIVCAACIFVAGVTMSAIPRQTYQFATAFRSIRLTNSAGNAPLLTARKRIKGGVINIELFSPGIPIQTYKDHQAEIESALNHRITHIDEGHDRQHIIMRLAPGDSKLPDLVYLPADPQTKAFEILLGVSLDGPVIVNLNRTPHLLIGGSTGSGKTQLMISVIAQLTTKRTNANHPLVDIYLIDLKGGQDYPPRWRGQDCSFCDNAGDALSVLSQIVTELEARKIRFAAAGVANGASCSSLDDYNRLSPDAPLRRIVVAVDEIAELTDTSGATKPEKEQIAAIVGKLATIARLGRAFGINLVIGTQRPDANAVPGQIKNNMDYRVCGKADNTLSIIILDSADAADLIPKDSQGLFLTHEGVLFRGYLYRTYLTISEAAEVLKISTSAMQSLVDYGEIEHVFIAGQPLIFKPFLIEYIEKLRQACYSNGADASQAPQGHLDNRIEQSDIPPSQGGNSEMAKYKINQSVVINGEKRWITANSMQEFTDKITKLLGTPLDRGKHLFADYAWNWYNTYSKPNVETSTATTYKRQIRLYLIPAFDGLAVEDITVDDVQRLFNDMTGAKATKDKARMVLNQILDAAVEDKLISSNPLKSRRLKITGKASKATPPYSVE